MSKEKQKVICSWLALVCGMLSFLWMGWVIIYLCFFYGKDFLFVPGPLIVLISFVAVFAGVFGSFGKVDRASRIRALVGVILVFLFWVILWYILNYTYLAGE